MPALKRTIILRSLTRNNLSIELNLSRPRASMSLRRRNAQHCISLPSMQQIDMCDVLELDPDDVLQVLNKTPQIRKYRDRSYLTWVDTGEPKTPPPTSKPEPKRPAMNLGNFLTDDDG